MPVGEMAVAILNSMQILDEKIPATRRAVEQTAHLRKRFGVCLAPFRSRPKSDPLERDRPTLDAVVHRLPMPGF